MRSLDLISETLDQEGRSAAVEALSMLATQGVVVLETASSVSRQLGITRQRVNVMINTAKMLVSFFCTEGGTPLWLPSQIEGLIEGRNDQNS